MAVSYPIDAWILLSLQIQRANDPKHTRIAGALIHAWQYRLLQKK